MDHVGKNVKIDHQSAFCMLEVSIFAGMYNETEMEIMICIYDDVIDECIYLSYVVMETASRQATNTPCREFT
jgi:hypothetical protein